MKIGYGDKERKFVESRLIAYIGNKRRLIKLIIEAFRYCDIKSNEPEHIPSFYDPFAGTGVISRFAKTQGFKVVCNDWEYYSYVINKLYVETDDAVLQEAFSDMGGIEKPIDYLNNLPLLDYDKGYIAKYYCPKDTEKPDLMNERLFYTRETGGKIDSIREEIDAIVKATKNQKLAKIKLYSLLAPLLYEASARSNTSGVFKAFHKGFGGTHADALSRILRKLKLETPILWENIIKHKVFKGDAIKLTKRLKDLIKFDIAYVDPPYNQHQYGSNYHLLNTIAYNDKPPVNKEIYIGGKKTDKSAIRKDWIKTKSGFCYRSSAKELFRELIQNINAKYILISYSVDGIIEFDDMLNILIEKGSLDIVTSQYVKYPGGKQSLKRDVNNVEFILIVNTEKKGKSSDKTYVCSRLLDEKIPIYFRKSVSIPMLEKCNYTLFSNNFFVKTYKKDYDKYSIKLDIIDEYSFYESGETIIYKNSEGKPVPLSKLPLKVKEQFLDDLHQSCDLTKEDELNQVLFIIEKNMEKGYYDIVYKYLPRIPYLLNKFNNRKAYKSSLNMIRKISKTFSRINKIKNLEIKKIMTSIKRLNIIVKSKLEHKANIDEMNLLKKSIRKEYYENIAKKYELFV